MGVKMSVRFGKIRGLLLMGSLVVLTALSIMILAAGKKEEKEGEGGRLPFSLTYRQDGVSHRIQGFRTETAVYFCVPGNLSLEDVYLDMETAGSLFVDGGRLVGGDTISGVELNRIYEAGADGTEPTPVIFMQGSKLPVIRLKTETGSMEAVNGDKEYAEAGFLEVYDEDGRLTAAAKMERFSGRGNTSWDAAKKSYAVKLEDAEDILGMGAAKRWVLCANYYDGAYIRNQIGFEIAARSGMAYTPEERFAELYINDEYAGLYQVMEKIEPGPNRMDIGNDYLLEVDYIERAVGMPYILLDNEQPVVVHAPEKNGDLERVQQFFDGFTADLENGNAALAMEKIDVDSFAKRFVMEEILQDMDFGYTSQYLYLDLEKGILHDGPLWDLDNTMGRGTAVEAEPLFVTDYELNYNNVSRWYAVLYGQADFRKRVSDEYQAYFRPVLLELINGGIEEKTAAIEASIAMDQVRFPAPRSVFMTDAQLEEHTAHLTNYLRNKLCLLDITFGETQMETDMEVRLPPAEVKENPLEATSEETLPEAGQGDGGGERGLFGTLMDYRFPAVLLVMCGSGVLLWYRCRKTGK